jgi:hypothetical protein
MYGHSLAAGLVHGKTGRRDDARRAVRCVALLQDEEWVERMCRWDVGRGAVTEEIAQLFSLVLHAGEYLRICARGEDEALECGEVVERRGAEGEEGRRVRGCTRWAERRKMREKTTPHVNGVFIPMGAVCGLISYTIMKRVKDIQYPTIPAVTMNAQSKACARALTISKRALMMFSSPLL